MSLMKWRDPFEEFRLLSDSLFDGIFNDFGNVQKQGYPKYDQYNRNDGSVVLEFPLAGYKPSELNVSVLGRKLVVAAERSQTRQDGERAVAGRSTQSFEKSFTADRNLDLENVKASFENGLLVVEIPAKSGVETQKAKKVDILVK